MRLVDKQGRGSRERVADGRQVGWHDIDFKKVIAAEPLDLSDLAITFTLLGDEIATEDDAHKLDCASVRVPADLSFGVAEHRDDAVEFDFTAELFQAFSTNTLGERFSGFEPATG